MVELEGARTLVPACSRAAEEGMVIHTDSERVRLNRKMVLEMLASSVDLSTTPDVEAVHRALRRPPRALRPAGPAGPRPRDAPRRTSRGPGRPDRRDRRRPGEARQRAVRPRLLEVHALLQVRRRLRRPASEHVRDHRRRSRLRCAHLDGVRGTAAGVRLRVLRKLHRRLPDGCADAADGIRAARARRVGRVAPDARPTRSARSAASAAT